MTTTLSQRLRDLRNGLFPDLETVNAVLDKAIAQAEAQEAQAGELSDEVIEQLAIDFTANEEPNEWPTDWTNITEGYRMGLRYARDHGSLKPSQAIGEQTPVAAAPVCMGCFSQEAVCRQLGLCVSGRHKWIPSGVSPEARDRAIEALDRLQSYVTLDELPRHYDEVISQALSALRGQTKQQPGS